jgi:hypothetical protein
MADLPLLPADSPQTEQAKSAQALHENTLLAKPNVVGVGVGYKESNGVVTDDVALVVLVEQKKPLAALDEQALIPREIDGMRTDVLEVGYLRANAGGRERYRPLIPSGVSIGHYKVTAGTLGTVVKDRKTGELFLLSNNHVLANSNDAMIGDAILQPAAMDGGQNPADVVARLERYVQLLYLDDPAGTVPLVVGPAPAQPTQPGVPVSPPAPPAPIVPPAQACDIVSILVALMNGLAAVLGSEKRVAQTTAAALAAQSAGAAPYTPGRIDGIALNAAPENRLDAALARPFDAAVFTDDIRQIGLVNQSTPPAIGMRVRKHGRTTDYTEGQINLLNATVNIAYSTARGPRTARFAGQVIVSGMSQGGDSGSLVVDAAQNRAVGLLFAGSNLATIFTPIDVVLNTLGVDL